MATGSIFFRSVSHYYDPLTNLKIKFLEPKAHFEIFTTNDGNWTTYLPVNTDVKAEILSTCGKIDDINLNTFNAQIVHDKIFLQVVQLLHL